MNTSRDRSSTSCSQSPPAVGVPRPIQPRRIERAAWRSNQTDALSHHRGAAACAGGPPSKHPTPPRPRSPYIYSLCHRPASKSFSPSALLFLVLLLVLSLLSGPVAAEDAHGDLRRSALSVDLPSSFDGLLFVDRSEPPPRMHLLPREDAHSISDAPTATKRSASASSLTTDPQSTSTLTSMPQPFDAVLGNNFTATCQTFFQTFLSNTTFRACHPFSLLLQTSSAFFDASKSFVRVTQTLDATCKVNFNQCAAVMEEFGRNIKNESNCAVDYANDSPLVLQAYNGFLAYQPLYQAGCLRDDSGSYCFANAITNTTAAVDAYPYYLPLGVTLPGTARPTCSTCLQDTMAIFSSFAGNTTQPISQTYGDAAQQIDIGCGPTFVNQTAAPLKGSAGAIGAGLSPMIALWIMLLAYFL